MPKFTVQEKIIHDQFVRYGKNAKEWTHKCSLLLPHIEKHQIWWKKGCRDIYEYARKLAGMSRYKVNESLRILKNIEDKPELLKIVEQKGIFAVKPVVTIVTSETASFWAEKARLMPKNTLETSVREFKKLGGSLEPKTDDFGRPRTSDNSENPHQQANTIFENERASQRKTIVAMELEPEIIATLEKLKGQGEWNEFMKKLLQTHQEHLDEQKPQAVKTSSRHIPNKIKKFINRRNNGQCAYPGCLKPAMIYQRTQRWALENIHDPDRLFGLCHEHDNIAHLGLIANEEQSPSKWVIRAQPDADNPKYKIDLVVQKFRTRDLSLFV